MRFLDCLVCCNKWYILYASDNNFLEVPFFAYFELCRRSMLHHVNCLCLQQFSFFLNLSVTCWLAVGRLSVTCRSTDGRQLTNSWPTGFLGSSSSQLPLPIFSFIQSELNYVNPHALQPLSKRFCSTVICQIQQNVSPLKLNLCVGIV